MILQRAAIFGGKRGVGFGMTRLGQDRLEHLLANDPHSGHRPQTRLRRCVTPRLFDALDQALAAQLLQVIRRLPRTVSGLAPTRELPDLGRTPGSSARRGCSTGRLPLAARQSSAAGSRRSCNPALTRLPRQGQGFQPAVIQRGCVYAPNYRQDRLQHVLQAPRDFRQRRQRAMPIAVHPGRRGRSPRSARCVRLWYTSSGTSSAVDLNTVRSYVGSRSRLANEVRASPSRDWGDACNRRSE